MDSTTGPVILCYRDAELLETSKEKKHSLSEEHITKRNLTLQ